MLSAAAHEICVSEAREMSLWLSKLSHVSNIQPVKVMLGKLTFFGCRYTATHQYTAGMDAVTRGDRKAGDTYTSDRFELIGQRPTKFKNRANFCFPFEGNEWYIGHYYEKTDKTEYHPFGKQFGIHCWQVPDGTKIDTYERFQYVRVPMSVEVLT